MGDKKEVKDYGGITIDPEGRTVKVDGKQVDMSLREYELLKYFDDIGDEYIPKNSLIREFIGGSIFDV